MNHIFKSGTYTWRQVGALKLALLSIGIAIGAYWPTVFASYAGTLAVFGLLLGVYLIYVWIRQ